MKSSQIELTNSVGLHARPAAQFVDIANRYVSDILICNLSKSGKYVNAKSILSILSCGVEKGDMISIQANGLDENEAVDAINNLILNDFQS